VGKVEDGQEILAALGLPPAQQTAIAAYTLLALASREAHAVGRRQAPLDQDPRIKEWVAEKYRKTYAENTVRRSRQVLHQLVQARVVDINPDAPSWPPTAPDALRALRGCASVIRSFETKAFADEAKRFLASHGALLDVFRAAREGRLVPVTLPSGKILKLSPGKHNTLQKAIIEDFAGRFAQGSLLLYLGDTAHKELHVDTTVLELLQIPVTKHDKLPTSCFISLRVTGSS